MSLLEVFKKCNFIVSTDSRNIKENSLFIALKGENFNGNKYAEESLRKGASFAIVDETKFATNPNILLVDRQEF